MLCNGNICLWFNIKKLILEALDIVYTKISFYREMVISKGVILLTPIYYIRPVSQLFVQFLLQVTVPHTTISGIDYVHTHPREQKNTLPYTTEEQSCLCHALY